MSEILSAQRKKPITRATALWIFVVWIIKCLLGRFLVGSQESTIRFKIGWKMDFLQRFQNKLRRPNSIVEIENFEKKFFQAIDLVGWNQLGGDIVVLADVRMTKKRF